MTPYSTRLATVDRTACERLAHVIRSQQIPNDREEIAFSGFNDRELGNLLLFVVSICHQTSSLGVRPLAGTIKGKLLRGWDYLLQQLVEAATSDGALLRPRTWARLTGNDLRLLYRNSDGEDLLTDVESRAVLVNDLGRVMNSENWEYAHEIHAYCSGRVNSGSPNLISSLAKFRAYSDPVCKKSYFLLSLMENTGLWTYQDPQNVGAPVDYHEVRGHLRIGTIRVNNLRLERKLRNRVPVTKREDVALRKAVLDAIILLSDLTGLRRPSQLHYLFWNVFRNYCTRDAPNCFGKRKENYLPVRYRHLTVQLAGHEACPFGARCRTIGRRAHRGGRV